MLWVEGDRSSNFLPVKMSMATMWTLAWPCLPVLEVDISTILHGRFLMTTCPFFLKAEHCIGKVVEAPASALPKSTSCCSNGVVSEFYTESRRVGTCRMGCRLSTTPQCQQLSHVLRKHVPERHPPWSVVSV